MQSAAPPDRFAVCLAELLRAEGGFNNIRQDRGGATNFGISMRFLTAEVQTNARVRALFPAGPITVATIRDLTRAQAASIYRWCFWDVVRAGELPVHIDHAVFDQAVNAGPGIGVWLLQRSINKLGHQPRLMVDRRIGPITLGAARQMAADPQMRPAMLTTYRHLASERYRQIVRLNPGQAIFLNGWLSRADKLGSV
jgi:lysozyme family protein